MDVAVSAAAADAIIKKQNELLDALVRMAEAFDAADHTAFQNFWYAAELRKSSDMKKPNKTGRKHAIDTK